MCDMHILCKIVMVCLRVAYPYFIFDRICVRTIRTHLRHILPESLSLTSKKVFSLCPVSLLPPLIGWGGM